MIVRNIYAYLILCYIFCNGDINQLIYTQLMHSLLMLINIAAMRIRMIWKWREPIFGQTDRKLLRCKKLVLPHSVEVVRYKKQTNKKRKSCRKHIWCSTSFKIYKHNVNVISKQKQRMRTMQKAIKHPSWHLL